MTAAVASLSRPARLLRLEIRRSVVSWAVPLLAVLFFVDAYRTAMGLPAVWTVRSSVVTSSMLLVFAVFAGGLGAWAGSREGRRRTGDLVATTVRPAWARQAAALGGTLFWLLLVFLAGVAVVYIQTARQTTWGSPPLWPVAVGVMAVVTITVLGFTAGALVPGRFTAPLAAVAAFVLFLVGYHAAVNLTPGPGLQALLSPAGPVPLADDGVFYRAAPDVAITQVLFMGGITIALLGVLVLAPVLRGPYRNLPAALSSAGRWLCAAAVILLVAGTAAAGTAFGLAGTARLAVSAWDIPALHSVASDQPVPYTADCAGTSFKVCVHPAFSSYLASADAALQPVAAEIAGLPGTPARAAQVPAGDGVYGSDGTGFGGSPAAPAITGTPPVYTYSTDAFQSPLWGHPAIPGDAHDTSWQTGFQQQFLIAFVTQPQDSLNPGPAQQAVVTALMTAAGSSPYSFPQSDTGSKVTGPSLAQVNNAARRFGSLSPATRHAWLSTHLAALRAGTITLAQVP